MKNLLYAVLIIAMLGAAIVQSAEKAAQQKDDILNQCISSMAKIQSYIEFFFTHTGVYPYNLEDMTAVMNSDVKDESKKISIPLDPATKQPFKYVRSKDGKTYILSAPDPSKYGLKKLQLNEVNWGEIGEKLNAERKHTITEICVYNLNQIATAVELYANDFNCQYPDKLEALLNRTTRALPLCPASGKPYVYEKKGESFVISCPMPEAHGQKQVLYDSNEGTKVK